MGRSCDIMRKGRKGVMWTALLEQMRRNRRMINSEQIIALLIDADNTQEKKMKSVIMEISAYGRIVVKGAYGNWTKEVLKKWEDDFRNLAIKPIQQIDYVKGKNATDMALVIDALDFLYTSNYDTYAIVSSDSDFTPLAIKLRESGKFVIGVGKESASEAFKQSCDLYLCLEKLNMDSDEVIEEVENNVNNKETEIDELDRLLQIAANSYQDDETGYTNVSSAGTYIKRVKPDFDISKYGVKKLPEYIERKSDLYEMTKYKGKGTVNIIAYKLKENNT